MHNTENAAKNLSKIKLEFPELWGRDVKNHKQASTTSPNTKCSNLLHHVAMTI